MPLYEEKLISPLAIRFTQQRIRHTFRDSREIEDTIKEITVGPAVGNYDITLQAPFPTIEIIRYSPNGRGAGGQAEDDHWFTFDNRRLYCLQRKAAEYWPKHVGCVVEVLYADNGSIQKKLDTMTYGLTVNIGHAFATAEELEEWSWEDDVAQPPGADRLRLGAPPGLWAAEYAETAVDADDAKTSVDQLTEAPGAPSSFERLAMAFAVSDAKAAQPVPILMPMPKPSLAQPMRGRMLSDDSSHDTRSTAATEEASRAVSEDSSPPVKLDLAAMKEGALCGVWAGEKHETYTVCWRGSTFHCVREDNYSSKKFTIEHDGTEEVLWWGIQKSYYATLSDLTEFPDQLRWYGAKDPSGRRPRFVWYKTHVEQVVAPSVAKAVPKGQKATDAGWAGYKKPQQGSNWQSTVPYQQQQKQQTWAAPVTHGSSPTKTRGATKWVAVANTGGA